MSRQLQVSSADKTQKLPKDGKPDFGRAWDHVDQNTNKFVDQLARLASQPSISSENRGLKECAELLRSMMVGLGIRTEMIPVQNAPDVVYGELRSGKKNAKTLVIYNHYDVQAVEPMSEWRTEPFKPQVKDGRIYGRGVGDDKGEIVARLCAIQTLIETGPSLRPNIKWVIEGEEETGSVHFNDFVSKHKSLLKGDGCLWEGGECSASGTPEIRLGTKGLVYVEFKVKASQNDLPSMYSPIVPNPAWRLIDLLKTIRSEDGTVLIDGFYDDVERPTPLEIKYLKNNEFNLRELKRSMKVDRLIEGNDDLETLKNLLYNPTANIAGLNAGYTGEGARTVIPAESSVKMDFRLVANMKAKDILEKIKAHLKSKGFDDVELVLYSMDDPAKTSVESYIAKTLIRSAEIVTGKQPNVWPTCPGTSVLSLFTDKLKLETAMGLGVAYPGSSFHAPNENIRVEDYKLAIKDLVCLFGLF